jgi:hypothetical protein
MLLFYFFFLLQNQKTGEVFCQGEEGLVPVRGGEVVEKELGE